MPIAYSHETEGRAVAKLVADVFGVSAEDEYRIIGTPGTVVFIGRADSRDYSSPICGAAVVTGRDFAPGAVHLHALVVHPDHRRHRRATSLLQMVIRQFGHRAITLMLDTEWPFYSVLRLWYAKYGFEATSEPSSESPVVYMVRQPAPAVTSRSRSRSRSRRAAAR